MQPLADHFWSRDIMGSYMLLLLIMMAIEHGNNSVYNLFLTQNKGRVERLFRGNQDTEITQVTSHRLLIT